jgi:hypothetical protein
MDVAMRSLQKGIIERQNELRNLVQILGKHSYRLQLTSNTLKVSTIILSAVTTAKGVADKIYGAEDHRTLIVFTLIGLITTVALGFEASFKLEKRAAELNLLSASTQATVVRVDSEWRKNIESMDDSDRRRAAARDLLTLQDSKLQEIHQKAASSGLNVILQVRSLEEPGEMPTYNAP